jgi:peroxiredoxin
LIGVVALASVGYLSSKFGAPPDAVAPTGVVEPDPTEVAKRTPIQDFTLTDAEGRQKKLSDMKGEVVILSFWASWCTPCLVELPTFAEIEKKFHDRGLRVVAVNVDEGDEGKNFAHDFWAKRQFPFPTYFDTQKTLAQQFEVDMLPSNFVIDRQGRLVFSSFGANDWSNAQTLDFIEGLLQEKL